MCNTVVTVTTCRGKRLVRKTRLAIATGVVMIAGATTESSASPTLIPPIAAVYNALGGASSPLGLPTTSTTVTACGNADYNNFQHGLIDDGASTGAHAVYGVISGEYQAIGRECGVLGLPLTNETGSTCIAGARYNNFQNGRITWTGPTGAQETQGVINGRYQQLGDECSALGLPLTNETGSTCIAGARYNNFQNGRITWTGPTGAQETQGVINGRYQQLGDECSALRLPVTNETGSTCIAGARYNNFQNGRITWTGPTGAQETQGLINEKYLSMEAECSVLGLPLNSESPSPCVAGARYNNFQWGRITWSATTGAHETQGVIGGLYQRLGAECSPLGLPITDERSSLCTAGARINLFENGAIEWTPATGAHSVQGLIFARWINQCGAIGLPLGEAYACGVATCQAFQSGILSVATGSCINTPTDFANDFLVAIGEPDTVYNAQAVVAWEMMEGGNWENTARYNPLDTTQPYDGSTPMNSVGVQAFRSWRDGLAANTITILNGFYGPILAALAADNSVRGEVVVARAVGNSPWGTPDFERLLGAFYQPPNPPNVVACSA